jgi:enterochelin esterase family protein
MSGLTKEANLASRVLNNSRRVWLQEPSAGQTPRALCLLLDGEYYLRMQAPAMLEELQTYGMLPPLAVAYLSHIDGIVRWPESFCNPAFARFVTEEATPFATAQFPSVTDHTPVILGGLSLTGLSATHAALTHPDSFAGVFSQSGSFWWNDMQLVAAVATMPRSKTKFRVVCGSRETMPFVDHGAGLIQKTSQLESNLAIYDGLRSRGFTVEFVEYDGGHDLACWKEDLPQSIAALL